MKVGIMQPYFFPYLGYFDLIRKTDLWIVFDTPQYIRHGWVNRNRVLHPKEGWQYVLVPLQKHSRETPINEIQIATNENWQDRILAQLAHYKKQARYFGSTMDLLSTSLSEAGASLCNLNITTLRNVCEFIGIPFDWRLSSDIDYDTSEVAGPGDWALAICRAVGATEYINPPGGATLFDPNKYASHGITLTIQKFEPMKYDTRRYTFEAGLSILDTLMWCRPDEIRSYLDGITDHATI